jgi:hypothetical protein
MLENTEKPIKYSKLISLQYTNDLEYVLHVRFTFYCSLRYSKLTHNPSININRISSHLLFFIAFAWTYHVNVKYHKSPVRNCHSEDNHSISIGMLIPSTTKYINMCSIVFIVPFYLIT